MKVQGHKGAQGEGHKGIRVQGCKDTGVQQDQGYKGTRGARAQECTGCECTRVQGVPGM